MTNAANNRHNGFANYETWCVNKWLTQTQGDELKKMARTSLSESDSQEEAITAFGAVLEWRMKPSLLLSYDGGLISALLLHAMENVDWKEIASEHIKIVEKEASRDSTR